MKKVAVAILILVILTVVGFVGWVFFKGVLSKEINIPEQSEDTASTTIGVNIFSSEVKYVLDNKLESLKIFVKKSVIVDAVKNSNEANLGLSLDEKIKLDNEWRSSEGVNDFMKALMTNDAAHELYVFQEDNPGYPEIFLTDAAGLIVATTDKTSDYYQADEDWWVKAYSGNEGQAYFGPIEYDESAAVEAVPLYVPIRDPGTRRVIGVIKALTDIPSIEDALRSH